MVDVSFISTIQNTWTWLIARVFCLGHKVLWDHQCPLTAFIFVLNITGLILTIQIPYWQPFVQVWITFWTGEPLADNLCSVHRELGARSDWSFWVCLCLRVLQWAIYFPQSIQSTTQGPFFITQIHFKKPNIFIGCIAITSIHKSLPCNKNKTPPMAVILPFRT